MQPTERTTPQNLEAELYVIGALCLNENAISEIAGTLQPEHFYRSTHRAIYSAALKLFHAGETVSIFNIHAELRSTRSDVESAYLTSCVEQVPGSAEVKKYAAQIIEKAQLRALIIESEKAIQAAYSAEEPAGEQLEALQNRLFSLAQVKESGGLKPIGPSVDKVHEELEYRRKHKKQVIGTPTGFYEFDQLTGGQHAAEFSIIAARPAMGKTSFVMQMAANIATGGQAFGGGTFGGKHEPMPVAFLSLEMSTEQLTRRLISQVAGVDGQKMVRGYTDELEHQRVCGARLLLRQAVMRVEDTPGMSPAEIIASLRRMSLEVGQLGLVVCDYLQLIEAESSGDNRARELARVCATLVRVSKTFNVPVVALSQLSRSVELQEVPRPSPRHLNESGAIEAFADNVHFLYRPGYYEKLKGRDGSDPTTEIITAKNRNGPTDTTFLNFRPEYARFENRAASQHEHHERNGYESNHDYYERQNNEQG